MTIHASFQEDLSIAGLLGMNGFFEHFTVTCERDVHVTFVHVTRDLGTFSPEELELQAVLFVARFVWLSAG